MGKKFEELKKCMDKKFSQRDESLKEMGSALMEKISKEVKSEIKKEVGEQNDKITRLEADKAMLQEQIKNLFTQNQRKQEDVKKLDQFGKRLYL